MSEKLRTKWTHAQQDEFRRWQEERMAKLNYPLEIVKELRSAREKWMPRLTAPTKEPT